MADTTAVYISSRGASPFSGSSTFPSVKLRATMSYISYAPTWLSRQDARWPNGFNRFDGLDSGGVLCTRSVFSTTARTYHRFRVSTEPDNRHNVK